MEKTPRIWLYNEILYIMTEFEITINGEKEHIHAKHIVGGNYLVRKLKTCNFAQVKYIETLFGDNCQRMYRIKNFYPSSKYAHADNIKQEVKLIKSETE